MKKIVNILLNISVILIIATLPIAFIDDGKQISFLTNTMFTEIKQYLVGLFTGDSLYYQLGDKIMPYFIDVWKYASLSYEYLALVGVTAILLSVFLAILVAYFRLKWINEVIGFVSIIPDFILVLLLQIGVVFITQTTGFRIASVASASREQPAILLPLICLMLLPTFYLLRTLLQRITEVSSEEYILVAKAKGLKKLHIYLFHMVPNLLPFLKADLHKVSTIMIGNLFIIEYLFNIDGMTEMAFFTPFQFGYQYDMVINSFLILWILYYCLLYTFKGLYYLIKRMLSYGN